MKIPTIVLVLASMLTACAGIHTTSQDRLSATFSLPLIAADIQPAYQRRLSDADRQRGSLSLTRLHVLAWQRTHTDNPYVNPFEYADSCIVWAQFRYQDGTPEWLLAHLYSDKRHWHIEMVYDAPIPGCRAFSHRPTNDEVIRFLKDTNWLTSYGTSNIIEAGICKRAWLDAIGVSPTIILSFAERPKSHVFYY